MTLAGSPAEFVVNTTNAGPGALAVTIDGPSKVQMDCQECAEGYKVTYTPMVPGSYLISIKYGGPYHIAGSPFKAKITGVGPGAVAGHGGRPFASPSRGEVHVSPSNGLRLPAHSDSVGCAGSKGGGFPPHCP